MLAIIISALLVSSSFPTVVATKQMLAAHNSYRAKVGSPPLRWSDELAFHAQQWADTLMATGNYQPKRDVDYGQNLYEISGGTATPADVVNAWASEQANYRYATNTCSARCGHYTQVVWRDTKEVGCGVARSARREVWVCDYSPHGNTQGERPY